MKNRILLSSLAFFATAIVLFAVYISKKTYKIAYVRTAELVYEYNGMKEARVTYKSQIEEWQSNVDTLRIQYQKCLSDYQSTYNQLSESERLEKQKLVKKLEDNLNNYSSVVKQQAQEKEREMTEAVLSQINSYIEAYGRKNGYDYIIGSSNGTLLYAKEIHDITDDVVNAINKEYKIMPAEQQKQQQ